MPRSSRSDQRFFGDVRNFTRDLFLAALGVAHVQLELLDVDRRIDVLLHQSLGENDCVLEVVSVPRHERHGDVAPSASWPNSVDGAVGENFAGLHLLAGAHDRTLVDRGVLVRAPVLLELVAVVLREARERTVDSFLLPSRSAGPVSTMISSAVTLVTVPGAVRDDRLRLNRARPSPRVRCRRAACADSEAERPAAACSIP